MNPDLEAILPYNENAQKTYKTKLNAPQFPKPGKDKYLQ